MASENNLPNGGANMFNNGDCYICKYLVFFDTDGYCCTLMNCKNVQEMSDFDCICLCEEYEE